MAVDFSEIRGRVGAAGGIARDDLERSAFVPYAVVFQVIYDPVVGEVAHGEFRFHLPRQNEDSLKADVLKTGIYHKDYYRLASVRGFQ
jgi:hypothetical protein